MELSQLQQFAQQFTPEIINLILIVFLIVLFALLASVSNAFASNEKTRQLKTWWDIVDDAIYDFSFSIVFHEDSSITTDGITYAAEYKKRYGVDIDVRLAYVIKQVELFTERQSNYDFDFFSVWNKAQRVYSERVKPTVNK